jgi:LysM repeat protein
VKQFIPERTKEIIKDNTKPQQVQVKLAAVRDDLHSDGPGQYYLVKEGDSLWGIARQFEMDPKELQQFNDLATNVIHPGDRLLVASSQPTGNVIHPGDRLLVASSQPTGAEFYHEVRSGDSLWTISRKYEVSPDEIKRWNNLRGNLIHPGKKLLLKVADAGEPMVDTIYQVRSGDSLWTIARRHNIAPEEIKRWNNLKDNTIYPGNRLLLKVASGG